MHIVFIITELNIVPFRIVKRLGHGAFFTAAIQWRRWRSGVSSFFLTDFWSFEEN
jgi:hypothetical protein